MNREVSVLIVLVILASIITTGFILMGAIPAAVFSVAFGGGVLLWLLTTYRTPVDPNKVIVPYLFAILLFIVHVYEEYGTDFEVAMTDITGFHVLEKKFLTFAAFLAPCLWILGAILLLKKNHLGYYFLSAFFVAMTIAELAHFVFPFMEDGTFGDVHRRSSPCTRGIRPIYGAL